ncbi:MAG: hypothetical protein LBP94_06350 [Zoogloeaceae bacterium]|jgi:hypothetical protein|nr:hypothetical protein [Zoogloeaceae bacterium]
MKAKVDLLDCSREPSDEQLEKLMQSVATEARAKAVLANTAMMCTLRKQVAEVCSRYHLSNSRILIAT